MRTDEWVVAENSRLCSKNSDFLRDNSHSDFLRDEKCFRATRRLVC